MLTIKKHEFDHEIENNKESFSPFFLFFFIFQKVTDIELKSVKDR